MSTTATAPHRILAAETSTPILASAQETEPARLSLLAFDPLVELWMLSKRFAAHARQLETQAATAISQSSNSAPATPGCFSSTFDV